MVCRARRVQNMGWTPSNSLWLATRGGDVYLSPDSGISERFDQAKLGSRGFGILDVGCVVACNSVRTLSEAHTDERWHNLRLWAPAWLLFILGCVSVP